MRRKTDELLAAQARTATVFLVLVGALAASIVGASEWRYRKARNEASALMTQGFSTLASEELEPHRDRLSETAEGCALLIEVNAGAGRSERLAWVAERCLSRGIRTPEVLSGLALSRELRGMRVPAAAPHGR